jgi:prepilin-type N-terminal cleavage/methylation domain-containing protein
MTYPTRFLRGFTLIEMSIVLVILGVLLGGLIAPFSTQLDASKRKGAETQLKDIHDALLGFAANSGRLPCPATAASNGLSAPNVATAACTSNAGFVPVATLGLNGAVDANGRLLDPWLNPLRYTLTTANSGAFSNNLSLGLNPNLQICGQSACTTTLTATAVAVVLSPGGDGGTTTSVDQLENIDADTLFVKRTFSEQAGAEFDDHLVWISVNTLVYTLVKAGQIN